MTHLAKEEIDSHQQLSYTKSIEREDSPVSIEVIIILRDCIYFFNCLEKKNSCLSRT